MNDEPSRAAVEPVAVRGGGSRVAVPVDRPAAQGHPLVRYWRKLGGGSLLLSVLIHLGLLLAGGVVVYTTREETTGVDFIAGGGGTAQGAQASQDLQHQVQQKRRTAITGSASLKKVVSSSMNASIRLPEPPSDMLDMPDVSTMLGGGSLKSAALGKGGGGGFGSGMGASFAGAFVSMPPMMKARCSAMERLEKLRQNGGTAECETAVSKALEWLKTKQNRDGSWGGGAKAGMTGLALLCYLGRCETTDSAFYGDNVTRGLMYLIELAQRNDWGYICENPKATPGAYEHGIATYALGEMYSMASLGSKSVPGLKETFERGVRMIIAHQNDSGGWDYYTANQAEKEEWTSKRDDLSVVGWQYQALKAARHSGLAIPGLNESIAKAMKYIESTQTEDGGFGARKPGAHYNQWSLTGAGALGLQTLSTDKTEATDRAIKFLRGFLTTSPLDWNKNCNLYCWYYYTQAFFQKGGEDWAFYNQQLLPQLLNNQAPDGSWKPERWSWEVASAGTKHGGVYKTALCVLQLEVYYRYLKATDRDADSFFEK